MARKLDEIIRDFDHTREAYRHCVQTTCAKDTLLEFQGRFVDLKADLRPWHNNVMREWTRRDDKSATAFKYRIATSMSKGEFEGYEKLTITAAEKFAAGCEKYKEFVEQRGFWRESLNNINDLRDDISSYLIEISNRLK